METIRVNMNPNPSDIQTIHCSQGDTEAREWEFELHNNGEVIDAGGITEQMVFKSYKGGTEQILPENGSVPTTSPIIADIKYPQGLLTDQEFLYRESPTEEDGLAKIQTIYGNTLKWNQLNTNIGGSETYHDVSFTKNDDGSWTINGTPNAANTFVNINYSPSESQRLKLIQGHKYYVKGADYDSGVTIRFYYFSHGTDMFTINNELIFESLYDDTSWFRWQVTNNFTVNNYKGYPQIFDLTMLGIDNLTLDEVKQWFADYYPLPYYQYDSGSLLPFRGEGLKTVGKNLINNVRTVGVSYNINGVSIVLQNNGSFILNGTCTGSNVLNLVSLAVSNRGVPFNKGSYILSGSLDRTSSTNVEMQYYIPSIGSSRKSASPISFTLNERTEVAIRIFINGDKTYNNDVVYPMLRFADVEDSSFEPYTSSTLSLPISTYFPTGMKSAGSVYDELTPTKAVTRIGAVDLGTLDYDYVSTSQQFRSTTALQDAKLPSSSSVIPNAKSALYNVMDYVTMINSDMSLTIIFSGSFAQGRVWIKNSNYTDATSFKTAMSGVYLYYELATPTETSFTTATLVTENGEVALANENGVLVGKCNSDVSADAGFIEGKIKLSDEDGDVYSNKIQIHVERSPQ